MWLGIDSIFKIYNLHLLYAWIQICIAAARLPTGKFHIFVSRWARLNLTINWHQRCLLSPYNWYQITEFFPNLPLQIYT